MAKDLSRHVEMVECLLPFRENGSISMRSVTIEIVVESGSGDGSATAAEIGSILSKLRSGRENKSLEDAFGIQEATFESLASAIYGLLTNPLCIWISDGGRSAYRGDPSALFPPQSGGGGSGVDVDAVRETLNAYATANEPDTQHALWESVRDLASSVASDLGADGLEQSQEDDLK